MTQSSQTAILNYTSFSIGANESTRFIVPTGGATLNRVVGSDPSSIYGSLTSNGSLFLVNQNGIVVGPSGVVTAANVYLSTQNITDQAFLAGGNLNFAGTSNASILNQGLIQSTGGGSVFLIARTIQNDGTLSAPGGTVGLAAGTDVLISASDTGDGRISVRPGRGTINNTGAVAAAVAELRAAGGNHYALAINNTGVVRATGVANVNGRVYLTANKGTIASSGVIAAHNANGSGGKVLVSVKRSTPATKVATTPPVKVIDLSGTIDVSGSQGVGGSIVLEADKITLAATANLNASGALGGGTIAIGGGPRGQDVTIVNATDVSVAAGAVIAADALQQGNGGQVTIWSNGTTNFAGSITAQARGASGNGGQVEVSGGSLIYNGVVNASAVNGVAGTLLLDPSAIEILSYGSTAGTDQIVDSTLQASLAAGTSVIVQTAGSTAGATSDITIDSGVRIIWNNGSDGAGGSTAPATLTLLSGGSINALNNIQIQSTQMSGALSGGGNVYVQKGAGGVVFVAAKDINIGSSAAANGVAIGSEFGQNIFYAGVKNVSATAVSTYDPASATFGTTGNVNVVGGNITGAYAQLGYIQPTQRGNNTGNDFSGVGTHAANGDITVTAGGNVALLGGSGLASIAQIGHGGVSSINANTADIASANIAVTSLNGNVTLDTQGVELSAAQIGHGSTNLIFAGQPSSMGRISGNISVSAGTAPGAVGSVILNGHPVADPSQVAANGAPDVFVTRIGNGSNLVVFRQGSSVTTGAITGDIHVTATGDVILGSALSPLVTDDSQQVFSQIGHGTLVRLVSYSTGGALALNLGAVVPYTDISQTSPTVLTDNIYVTGRSVQELATISAPLNGQPNLERAQIGSGNTVRQNSDIIENGYLPFPILPTTSAQYVLTVNEGDLSGNINVASTLRGGMGISLTSTVTSSATVAADANTAETSIGHGSFIQLTAPDGQAAVPGTSAAIAGGSIIYNEANVLLSAITVQTNSLHNDNISLTATDTAGSTVLSNSTISATIGSGSDVTLVSGNGGLGGGVANTSAYAGGNGGDITFNRGTVWDGIYPTGAVSSSYSSYDTSITVASAGDLSILTGSAAGKGASSTNTTLGRIGHGDRVSLTTGNGGSGSTLGSNGGRGGDISVTQQNPGRDYGGTGAADDSAWGLRGAILLSANDLTGTPALSVQSLVASGLASASFSTSVAQIGHGDTLVTQTGNGGSGGTRGADTFVTTAAGGRGGNTNINLSNRLIESSITGTIAGEVLVDAETSNALAASSSNISQAGIGHGDSIQAIGGNGNYGGTGTNLTNGVAVQDGQATADSFLQSASAVGAARGGTGGDIQILTGTITDRRGLPGGGFAHDANANVNLTITGANPAKLSLSVNAAINAGQANGIGDDVASVVGAYTRVKALGGAGGGGGRGSAIISSTALQNDASGGRGGDVRTTIGNFTGAGTGTPANTLVIGQVNIQADHQVSVTTNAGPGYTNRAIANLGPQTDVVTMTQSGGTGGDLYGSDLMTLGKSSGVDGIATQNSGATVQVLINRDGSQAVSLTGSGVPDSIQTVAAARANAAAPTAVKNAIFYDKNGNPELIVDDQNLLGGGAGKLVSNVNSATDTAYNAKLAALRGDSVNSTLFGRTVADFNAGTNNSNVQYVELNFGQLGGTKMAGATGRPDVFAANLNATNSWLTVLDVNNDHVYDQISGRVALGNGNLGAFGLLDYTYATGKQPTFATDAAGYTIGSGWALADFSTSNGGRGGNASTAIGNVTTYTAAGAASNTALVVVNAGLANTSGTTPTSNGAYDVVVSSTLKADSVSTGSNNQSSARIGANDYLIADADGSYVSNLAGAAYVNGRGAGASGGSAGSNAVNGSGGTGGNANVTRGAIAGDILINSKVINPQAVNTRGVLVHAFTDDVTSNGMSIAAIGMGGIEQANAQNTGGNGNSNAGNIFTLNSSITAIANGGNGGAGSVSLGAITSNIVVLAGGNTTGGDFALVVEAIKGGSGLPPLKWSTEWDNIVP